MCNGRFATVDKAMATVDTFSVHVPKATKLVVTVEGLLSKELTVQNGEFNAHQLPPWFNEQASEEVGDAKWKLFCEELELVKRGYCYANTWLQQLPWVVLGVITVTHSCFAGLCLLIAGNRFEQKLFIDQHKALTEKFLRGKLDREHLSDQGGVKPFSSTNWEELFLNCGYRLATSTRTETIISEGQEENYFIEVTFSPTGAASSE
jgi:hypothetical protein